MPVECWITVDQTNGRIYERTQISTRQSSYVPKARKLGRKTVRVTPELYESLFMDPKRYDNLDETAIPLTERVQPGYEKILDHRRKRVQGSFRESSERT